LEREQRTLDPAERPQGAGQGIAGTGRGKLAQHRRRQHRTGLDRGLEPHELGPLVNDRGGIDHPADQRLQ